MSFDLFQKMAWVLCLPLGWLLSLPAHTPSSPVESGFHRPRLNLSQRSHRLPAGALAGRAHRRSDCSAGPYGYVEGNRRDEDLEAGLDAAERGTRCPPSPAHAALSRRVVDGFRCQSAAQTRHLGTVKGASGALSAERLSRDCVRGLGGFGRQVVANRNLVVRCSLELQGQRQKIRGTVSGTAYKLRTRYSLPLARTMPSPVFRNHRPWLLSAQRFRMLPNSVSDWEHAYHVIAN